MTALAIIGDRDTAGRKDWSTVFRPEADRFVQLHGGAVVRVDLGGTAAAMRKAVLDAIAQHEPRVLAVLCHGYTSGLQVGFRRPHAAQLAEALSDVGCDRVVLYACSTGGGAGVDGDGGFADRLRDELCKAHRPGCRVDAHVGPGHATRRPYVRRFEGMGSSVGGAGGFFIVAPKSPLWSRWRAALQGKGDLRLRFPLMLTADVHAELLAGADRVA